MSTHEAVQRGPSPYRERLPVQPLGQPPASPSMAVRYEELLIALLLAAPALLDIPHGRLDGLELLALLAALVVVWQTPRRSSPQT
jgi:hypothetical protein